MLKHTFRHIYGIGEKTERRLWAEGLISWEVFLGAPQQASLPQWQRDLACCELERSLCALEQGAAHYFTEKLPAALHWRLYPEFGQRIAYLDIETTGVSDGRPSITVIGLYDGEQPHVYIQGQNLSRFVEDIAPFTLLVTYNGKLFDLPCIRQELGVPLEQAHIDLRYPLAVLGYKGGLKKIERDVGIQREGPLALLDGWCAVILWQYHERGEQGALETLLRYNLEDVIHLPSLLALVYNTSIGRLPFRLPLLEPPSPSAIPFGYDHALIERVLADTGRAMMNSADQATSPLSSCVVLL